MTEQNEYIQCGAINHHNRQCPWRKDGENYCQKHIYFERKVSPDDFHKLPKCVVCRNRFIQNEDFESSTCYKCEGKEIPKKYKYNNTNPYTPNYK
jgi:hypothetical protein